MAYMKISTNPDSFKELKSKFSMDFESLFIFMEKVLSLNALWTSSGYSRHAGTAPLELFCLSLYKIVYCPKKSVNSFFGKLMRNCQSTNSMDSLYRFMKNSKINWRCLLYRLVKALHSKASNAASTDSVSGSCSPDFDAKFSKMTFWALDDSLIPKSGRHIEGVSSVHDHTSGQHRIGYKLLGLAVIQGTFSTLVDFALVAEKALLSKEKPVPQKKPRRDPKSFGNKRRKELKKKKTDLAVEMIGRSVKKGLKADYILFDSWFFCLSIAQKITTGKVPMHFVGGIKRSSRKFFMWNEFVTLDQIQSKMKNHKKRNRRFNSHYFEVVCELEGLGTVKIFGSKFTRSRKWVYLITSDTRLTYEQTVRIYSKRWNIEIVFKELKHYMGIQKCQSTSLDTQIAHMTCICMLHAMIRLYQERSQNATFGELFANIEDQSQQAQQICQFMDFFEEAILWLSEILGGVDKVSVKYLFNSSEYAEIKAILGLNHSMSLPSGSKSFELKTLKMNIAS